MEPAVWGIWNTNADCITRIGIYKNQTTARVAIHFRQLGPQFVPVPLFLAPQSLHNEPDVPDAVPKER
jgi:hypothetical protein